MKKIFSTIIIICALIVVIIILSTAMKSDSMSNNKIINKIQLPSPRHKGSVSVEEALLARRSIRDYKDEPLTLAEISQLLWAAQGITNEWGGRTAPSAGALYPLELYIVIGNVNELDQGIYKYKPKEHELIMISKGDKRDKLATVALGQSWVRDGAIVLVLAAQYSRTTNKYGERGKRYVYMEAGHAAQNVYLQAIVLNLGTVVVGAFDDEEVKKIVQMPQEEQPLYLMPVGKIK